MQLAKASLKAENSTEASRTLTVRHGPQAMHIQVALKWAEGTYSWWSVLLSVFQMRSLPSWAHNAKYCRDLGEKTQGSCSDELPPSAAISEALPESACSVVDQTTCGQLGTCALARHQNRPLIGCSRKTIQAGWFMSPSSFPRNLESYYILSCKYHALWPVD